jgi:hypothetical protein
MVDKISRADGTSAKLASTTTVPYRFMIPEESPKLKAMIKLFRSRVRTVWWEVADLRKVDGFFAAVSSSQPKTDLP